ncbi:malonic semialdehyde reductase [Pseudomonas sp. JM0905a]|uniref:Putative NADH dehydrogenase/NAD(P)H nitroreductase NNO07_23550 n=1 Tax=Metapseudomonas resinovorans TaxID=53412 RepID=A0ABT4YAY7_METRE|nr:MULTISPECIES: malonic semialdehyde reductase [Pseudomonas]MBD2839780.1 malonic semialdehyde reductase [Pseudomonas sp. JM0905a]MDA8486049.1 malonic semialdehyde reductase [Pseudomonas resinovorans]
MSTQRLSEQGLDLLFRQARSQNGWRDQPVDDETLVTLYDLVRWGPTSVNSCPARIVFLRSTAAKQRLLPALSPGNVDKVLGAPVTAIIGYDAAFHHQLPRLFPHNPDVRDWFAQQPDLIELTALRNSSLQGGYFILAARALGLDCGPMSGFDHQRVDREFFGDDSCFPGMQVKTNFLCNLGYGDPDKLFPRSPRLSFEECCSLL